MMKTTPSIVTERQGLGHVMTYPGLFLLGVASIWTHLISHRYPKLEPLEKGSDTMETTGMEDDIHGSVSRMLNGHASSSASSSHTTLDDDITPFPSPILSATSLAGLSCEFSTSVG